MDALKRIINENADKNDQNISSDDEDQCETTKSKHEDLENVLQNVTLSFGNVEGMSEQNKTMIKNIIEIAQHNLDEKMNGLQREDTNLLKDCTIKVNATLKEIKSDITGINKIN